ncbi:hypothetical protein ACFO9Q_19435 [Paenibacillus sp. GCM10023252]|uniref:hypothetical protein n=1 Tax=Paenibacillus sp. GCM10023252 TaxID=3252649 RepID=UPI00360E6373
MMTTKTATVSSVKESEPGNIRKLVAATTVIAWAALAIGLILCLMNLGEFNDRNTGLMVGLGFLVGSVHIYVIGTAMGLVQTRINKLKSEQSEQHTDE